MRQVTRKVFAQPGQPAAQSEQQAAAPRRQTFQPLPIPPLPTKATTQATPNPYPTPPRHPAALLRHEEAATSAAGALDADSSVSDATTPPGTADTEEKPLPEYLSVLQRTDC